MHCLMYSVVFLRTISFVLEIRFQGFNPSQAQIFSEFNLSYLKQEKLFQMFLLRD